VQCHSPDKPEGHVVLTGDYLSHGERGLGLLSEQLCGLRAPVLSVRR